MLQIAVAPASASTYQTALRGIDWMVREDGAQPPRPPKLLERLSTVIRTRHLSRRTETAYVYWVRRFILFHDKRHPLTMGATEVTEFLSHLAVNQRVSASTQNQALAAVLFLYRLRGAPRKRYYV